MMDEKKFAHNRSKYERPNFPYRCGRGALWLKPCHQGPDIDGACGGTAECAPTLKGNHWECSRPQAAGGPCGDGPLPQGMCSQRHPPCVPKATLRVYRARLILLAFGTIVSLLCLSWVVDQAQHRHVSFNPGPMSSAHVKFAENKGCEICHATHNLKSVLWLKSVLHTGNISAKCEDCHLFGGPALVAHNGDRGQFPRLQKTDCLMCHREHRGPGLAIRTFNNTQCNHCHEEQFKSFTEGHPEFPENYPHTRKNTIKFDHISHWNKYFVDPKFEDRSPKDCMVCHKVTQEEQIVSPDKFEGVCASCHEFQIPRKELVLMRLPELDRNRIDVEELKEACRLPRTRGEKIEEEDDEFVSISTESPSLISAYLLNVPEDDPESYSESLQDLILNLAVESTMPIADLINEHSPTPVAEKMLAGLNPEVLKRAACAWGLNVEYDPPAEASFGGWHADLLEVRYTPSGHEDPVAQSWIEFALTVAATETDPDKRERAEAMRDLMLSSKEGVGGCIKCHAVTAIPDAENPGQLTIDWGYKGARNRAYLKYSHKNHLDLLGKGDTCKNCHVLDPKADFLGAFDSFDPAVFKSNFSAITRKTCLECHSEGKVREDCQLCHVYHHKPGFKKEMLLARNDP